MSIVALKWVSLSVSQLDQLATDGEPVLPFGASTATGKIVGEGTDATTQAVQWSGTTISALGDVSISGGTTTAAGISSDDSVIVGWAYKASITTNVGARWTTGGTVGSLLTPFAGFDTAIAGTSLPPVSYNHRMISADGTKIPGTSLVNATGVSQATIWTNGTPAVLPFPVDLFLTSPRSVAYACDSTCAVVLGSVWPGAVDSLAAACFWSSGVCHPLAPITGKPNPSGAAWACLSNGSVIWGYPVTTGGGDNGPWYWDDLGTPHVITGSTYYGTAHFLQSLPAGTDTGVINAVADALVGGQPLAVGYAKDSGGDIFAVRWDGITITNLGALPGGATSKATGVAADGSKIVGWSYDVDGVVWPVYWDASNVIHKLATVADPGDFFQGEALGISPDGTLIWGDGDGPTAPPPVGTNGPMSSIIGKRTAA